MTQETKAGTQDPLAGKMMDHIAGLEKLIESQQSQDDRKLAAIKDGLSTVAETSKTLKAEYESLLERFGPLLQRMQSLNMEILRSFTGRNHLGDIAVDAKQLHQSLTEAIARVGSIPGQVNAFKLQDLFADVQGRIREEVQSHEGGPGRLKDKIAALLKRMEAFERARQA